MDGKRVHPARALDHMSASAGYAALNEENPWGPLVEQIEALAKGFEIPVVEPTLADGRAQGTRDYLADLQARLETHRKDRDLLEKQLEICTKGAESFAHFSTLDVPVELTQQCEYVKIRFAACPSAGMRCCRRISLPTPTSCSFLAAKMTKLSGAFTSLRRKMLPGWTGSSQRRSLSAFAFPARRAPRSRS